MSEYEGILDSLESLHEKLDRLLASKYNPILGDGIPADARFPASGGEKEGSGVEVPNRITDKIPQIELDDSKLPEPKPLMVKMDEDTIFDLREPVSKEELDMDFKNVTIMNQSEKALLVVKKGYQQWLAKQFINKLEKKYDNGVIYDIKLKEKSDAGKPIGWLTKKWKPFEVFKQ